MEQLTEFTREVVEALGSAFPDDEIEFLPRATSGGMALGLPYIDARSVMRRLDAVVGPGNWSFDFDLLSGEGKMVKGRLTVLGVTKCDAGEAGAEDEPLKSSVSDALKRTAVHFGIGRYLYYLPRVWAPFDSQKRRFIEPPRLDPQAVRKALGLCGITSIPEGVGTRPAPSRPAAARPTADRVSEPAPQRSAAEAPAGEAPGEEAGRKSIWSAGGRTSSNGAASSTPESTGDRAATRGPRPEPATAAAPRPEGAPAALVCRGSGCGKALTKGQHDLSVRAFGQPLCPACQKLHARVTS